MINFVGADKNDLWYLVGLIATDGSLSKDNRHIVITSKDEQILLDIKASLNLNVNMSKKSSGSNKNKEYSVLQIGDVRFFKFLTRVGLCPNKSLSLGTLNISFEYFDDFLRGVIDGDGCIFSWKHPTNGNMQASLRIASAAPIFARWLFSNIINRYKVPGQFVTPKKQFGKNQIYYIKFGKLAAEIILKKCYDNKKLANLRKVKQVNNILLLNSQTRKYEPRWRNW